MANDIASCALALVAVLLCFIYLRTKRAHTYWARQGVPYLPPTFPFGNIGRVVLRKQHFRERMTQLYRHFKDNGHRYGGVYFFSRKTLMPIDPAIFKHIFTVDFQHFVDRPFYNNETSDPLSAHLFTLEGHKWKIMRAKLTPTFTSGKLKMMLKTVSEKGDGLIEFMNEIVNKNEPVDMKELLARFATDVIGTCAFGIECNCLRNPNAEFRAIGKRVFTRTVGDAFVDFFYRSMPWLAKAIRLRVIAPEVSSFFLSAIHETVNYREKNSVSKNDFLQLLIQLKNRGSLDEDSIKKENQQGSLTLEECAAQAFVFFMAGFETSSSTMSFCLFELSLNSDIQKKVREEVLRVVSKHGGEITYEALADMTYLDQCVCETLRKYPSCSLIVRRCTRNWPVPDTNGTVIIETGTSVMVPVCGIHSDPDYYPEPERFDPERFSEEGRRSRPDYTFLPFGEGPRNCIGLRFGMMQTKAGIALLLRHFSFSINDKTALPLVLDKTALVPSPLGGLWLDVARLQ